VAHLELLPKQTRISDLTIEVKPMQAVNVGIWGFTEGLKLVPTFDDPEKFLGDELPKDFVAQRDLGRDQKQITFRKEGRFRLDLRMGTAVWDWARIFVNAGKAVAPKSELKGSGTLNLEILWTGRPDNNPLPHYISNTRNLLQHYGFKLNFNINGDYQPSKLIDFKTEVIVSAAGNLDQLAKVVVARPEYKKGDSVVVVMAPARQHTDAAMDDGSLNGISVGSDYGVTGNMFVLMNYNKVVPDGMTLLHEMCHCAGYHGHAGENGRPVNREQNARNVMAYAHRRNELDAEAVRNLNAAFFRSP
jgi:hypothetical protein